MKIKKNTWLIFIVVSILSVAIWHTFSYPLFVDINLSVTREEALKIAKNYVDNHTPSEAKDFKTAIVFTTDYASDRYLQKSIGFEETQKFLKKYDFELFFWVVRFFKEGEKEGYMLTISSATGEVTGFRHYVDDSAKRKGLERDPAKEIVIDYLKEKFNFQPENYWLKAEFTTEYDNRADHSFTWQHNDIYIKWNDEEDTGGGKLLIGATIAGEEVLGFSKRKLEIPDQFNRDLSSKANVAYNFSTALRILYIFIFVGAIFFLVLRRNHLAMHTTKKFYFILVACLFVLSLCAEFNQFEHILKGYDTTQPFDDYLGRYFINVIIGVFFATIGILIPCLSGETLNYEIFHGKKHLGFLHNTRSTFFSREVAQQIVLGYLVCLILIGMQSLAYEFGRKYLGVWLEFTWVTKLASTYFPFLAALYIGVKASFTEEIIFRLFSISWLKKFFKSTFVAVLIASFLWGFGHTGYLIYPMWFRGVEVTILGIFISFVFLRFGIIPVLVAHYLFDVFWSSIGYIFGKSDPFNFYSSLFILTVPLIFAFVAFMKNKSVNERPLKWLLNPHQLFNLEVLKSYIHKMGQAKEETQIKKDLLAHGWDLAVIDVALEDLKKGKNPDSGAE